MADPTREQVARAIQRCASKLYRGTLLDLGELTPDGDLPEQSGAWFMADDIIALFTPPETKE